jgi:hypothetical protein
MGKAAVVLAPLFIAVGLTKAPSFGLSPFTIAIATIGVYVALISGLIGWSLARSIGPEIAMSDLEYDEEWLALFVRIENKTDAPTIPEVYLLDVTDSQGITQPKFMGKIEAHWRNYPAGERPLLSIKGAWFHACPLKLFDKPDQDGDVALLAYPIDHHIVPVSDFTTIEGREVLYVTIAATCTVPAQNNDEKRVAGNRVMKKFELTPIQGSTAYSIRAIKP